MNGSPAVASLRRTAASGLGRGALAGAVLVLAAIVVTMSGGTGLGGRLGALFGLHARQGGEQVSQVQAAAPAPVKHAVASASRVQHAQLPHRVQPKRRTRPHSAPAPQRVPASGEAPRPAPAQQPAAPSPPPPPPSAPPPRGNVLRAVQGVRETVAPLAPPAQPALDRVAQTVDQACGGIGGCP